MSKELPLYGFGGSGGGSSSYLYNMGKQKYAWGTKAWQDTGSNKSAQPTAALLADGSIYIGLVAPSSGTTVNTTKYSGVYHLLKDFDLTNVNQLVFNGLMRNPNGGSASFYLAVVPRAESYWATGALAKVASSFPTTEAETERTMTLDVSGISGSYDVLIGLITGYANPVYVAMKTLKAVR